MYMGFGGISMAFKSWDTVVGAGRSSRPRLPLWKIHFSLFLLMSRYLYKGSKYLSDMPSVKRFQDRRSSPVLGDSEAHKSCSTPCLWADPIPVATLGRQPYLWLTWWAQWEIAPGQQGLVFTQVLLLDSFVCSHIYRKIQDLFHSHQCRAPQTIHCAGTSPGFQLSAASLRVKNLRIITIPLTHNYPFSHSLITIYILNLNSYYSIYGVSLTLWC